MVKRTPLKLSTKQDARALRQKMTPAEELMWEALRNRRFDGMKFRRQHPLRNYILDFYCPEKKLGIELDGSIHLEPDVKRRDGKRDSFLKSSGVTVLRFNNSDVTDRLDWVLEKLREELNR